MSEFDITIRAKSKEAADALVKAVGVNPDSYELVSTVMVPDVFYKLQPDGSSFDPVTAYLNENPTLSVHDLKHNGQKTWEEEIRDLGALILLSEKALREENEVAKEGIWGVYSGKGNGIPTKIWLNKKGERVDIATFERVTMEVLRASFEAYAKEPESPKKRPVRSLLRPNEIRILIESAGLTGERISYRDIIESEGVGQISTQRASAISRIGWNL